VLINLAALIQGFNRTPEPSPTNTMNEVELESPQELPTITLITPETTQLETSENSILISFRSNAEIVTVNGNQLNLSRNNQYETEVLLIEGSQLITIQVENSDGQSAVLDILINKVSEPISFTEE